MALKYLSLVFHRLSASGGSGGAAGTFSSLTNKQNLYLLIGGGGGGIRTHIRSIISLSHNRG